MKQTNVMTAQEYAQGKELVKRLCKLYHGSFVPDAPISRTRSYPSERGCC